jgi:hypothetical protein
MPDDLPTRLVDPRCPSEQPAGAYNYAAGPWYALASQIERIAEFADADDLDTPTENAVAALYEAARALRERLSAKYPDETEEELVDRTTARSFVERCGFFTVISDDGLRWRAR